MGTTVQAKPVSSTVVRVVFPKPVREDPFFLDPDSYSFEPEGLSVIGVWARGLRTLDLLTTPQETDKAYRLMIKERNRDAC